MAQCARAQCAFVPTPPGWLARFSRRPRSRQEATRPGAIQPGAIQPGAIQPGAIQPGAIQPGATTRWVGWGLPGVLLGGLLGYAGPARAQDYGLSVARHFAVRQVDVGTRVARLAFRDTTGVIPIDPHRAAATVVFFVAASCGESMAYDARMREFYDRYTPRGVQFYFMSSYGGTGEPRGWQGSHSRIRQLIHYDLQSQLANRLGPEHTPEIYVFDSTGTVRYRGAIDDGGGQGEGQDGSNAKHPGPYLQWALDAVLAGKPVPIPRSKSFGCMVHATHPPGSAQQ